LPLQGAAADNKRESVMGELGRMYRRHMVLRGFSENTIESYKRAMVALTKAYPGRPPDQLSKEEIQAHLVDLITKQKLSWSTVNICSSAFRLFYHEMLKRTEATFSLPPRKAVHRLPPILDRASVRKILDAHRNPKHRAILALAYGSGLRVSEICHLRPCHIESAPDRMMVRVEQGGGKGVAEAKGLYLDIGHCSSFLLKRKHHLAVESIQFLVAGQP